MTDSGELLGHLLDQVAVTGQGGRGLDFYVGLARLTVGELSYRRLAQARADLAQVGAYGLYRGRGGDRPNRAALEVDAEVEPPHPEGDEADGDDGPRQGEPVMPPVDEVVVGLPPVQPGPGIAPDVVVVVDVLVVAQGPGPSRRNAVGAHAPIAPAPRPRLTPRTPPPLKAARRPIRITNGRVKK